MAEQLKRFNTEILKVESKVQGLMKSSQLNPTLPFQVDYLQLIHLPYFILYTKICESKSKIVFLILERAKSFCCYQ